MANIYVRSTDGSDSDNGSTWALSKAKIVGAAAIDAAGDTIFLSSAHSETTAADVILAFAGTPANPTRVYSVSDAAEPPTSKTRGAKIAATQNSIQIEGTGVVIDGVDFELGESANRCDFTYAVDGGFLTLNDCKVIQNNWNALSSIAFGHWGSGFTTKAICNNTSFKFGGTSNKITVLSGALEINGGSIITGSTATEYVFSMAITNCSLQVSGFDMSNASATAPLVYFDTGGGKAVFRNCKLPTGWTGGLSSTFPDATGRVEMYNCDSSDTNYRLWVGDYYGSVKSETTNILTGGASDGTTSYSWKMESSANCNYPSGLLYSPEIALWNDTTGSSKTVTVEIAQNSSATALTDGEIWLEVQYLGTSGFPLSTFITDAKASPVATAADQTSSSVTWAGLTTPTKQKISVTFTPQEKGYFQARVCLAKASTTVYVDPKLTVA